MKKLIIGLLLCMLTYGITAEFNKGIDLTGKTAISISQLHQLVDQAYPATDRGMVIVTNNTPNTSANSYYTNYLWYDISTSPPQLKSFYTNEWILATIPAGSVGTLQLGDYGVTAAKLGTNSVNTYAISNNAVTTDKIASSAVTEDKIYNQAVSSNKLANDAIYTASIADRQVTGAKLAVSTITYTNMADNSIRNEAITNGAVDTVSITNGTILAEDFAVDGGSAYDRFRINAGATAWEKFTPDVPGLGIKDVTPTTFDLTSTTKIANWAELPDIADGSSIDSVSLTVAKSSSKIELSFNASAIYYTSAGIPLVFAVFRGDTDACIYSYIYDAYGDNTTEHTGFSFSFYVAPYQTGSVTYKLRVLCVTSSSPTFYLGLRAAGGNLGNTTAVQLVAKEIFTEAP